MVGRDKQPDLGWILELVWSLTIQNIEKALVSVLLSYNYEVAEA
jgi:hypothetical protein